MCVSNTDTLPTEENFFILNVCSNSTRQFEINKLCRVVRASVVEKRRATPPGCLTLTMKDRL